MFAETKRVYKSRTFATCLHCQLNADRVAPAAEVSPYLVIASQYES